MESSKENNEILRRVTRRSSEVFKRHYEKDYEVLIQKYCLWQKEAGLDGSEVMKSLPEANFLIFSGSQEQL